MQSDGNSICGDDVLDSFNEVCRVEDNILKQKKEAKMFDLKRFFLQHLKKMHAHTKVALKPNEYEFFVLECLYYFRYAFSSTNFEILNIHNEDSKNVAFHIQCDAIRGEQILRRCRLGQL